MIYPMVPFSVILSDP